MLSSEYKIKLNCWRDWKAQEGLKRWFFFNAQSNVYNNRGEQGHFSWMPTKFWIPDYQALFLGKYQHHSLCRHTQTPEKKSHKQKIKKHVTHCPKGPPYNVKGNRKFKHFQCNIVPLFKLPVKKINTQTLNGGKRGRVWIVLFSVKLPHLRTCTQQLCRPLEKWSLDNILIIMM